MDNTLSQIDNHFVFAVENRQCLIRKEWKSELYKYMAGIALEYECKALVTNGMADHIHMLISMSPKISPSDLMYNIKRSSSMWINEEKFIRYKFIWQEGFGVFSYGKSQIPDIANYIENQEKHHKKRTFIEEYKEFLKVFEIEYDERYVFKEI